MPAKMPRISFAPTLVTGVSRQLTREEHWTLYYFEEHAAKCVTCYNPAMVHMEGRQLCGEGRELAGTIAALLFHMKKDGHIYVKEGEQLLRIEMPAKYQHVSGLFKAIEASRNGILHRQRSMDPHYMVHPRPPVVHYPVSAQHAGHAADDFGYDYYRTRGGQYMAQTRSSSPRRSPPSSPRFSPRGSRGSWGSPRGSGSLYLDDQLLLRQQQERERFLQYRTAPTPFRRSRTLD